MQRSTAELTLFGAAGGLIAGAVVAIWFLFVDAATTEALYTPSLLGATIFREEFQWPTLRLALGYSVLHFGVFLALGVATAWLLRTLRVEPGLLVGAVFGIGVLNAVHYGGLLVTGVDLLTVLPVVHVFGANLAGGMLMMAFLHRVLRAESPLGLAAVARYPLLGQGLATGLLGAGAVALWFFVVDILTGIPFSTPAALGSAVFLGADTPQDVQLNVGLIAAYSVLHLAAFSVVGVGFTWAADRIERAPGLWLLALMALIVLEALFVAVVGIVSEWVLGVLGWVQVGIGNLLAVAAMGTWLWRTRPRLREQLAREPAMV
jgi:hypothetical protein